MICKGNPAKFFLAPELWEVVAKVCLKSELWMDGMLLGKLFRGLREQINSMNMELKC